MSNNKIDTEALEVISRYVFGTKRDGNPRAIWDLVKEGKKLFIDEDDNKKKKNKKKKKKHGKKKNGYSINKFYKEAFKINY